MLSEVNEAVNVTSAYFWAIKPKENLYFAVCIFKYINNENVLENNKKWNRIIFI